MKCCVACGHRFDGDGWGCPACGFAPDTTGGVLSFVANTDVEEPREFDQATFDAMLAAETRSFYWRARRDLIAWGLARHFAPFRTYYDFGVGTGFMLRHVRARWPEVEAYGSDLSRASLRTAASRVGNATLFHTDADRIPFADAFDVIGTYDVIEHIDDDVGALRALRSALRPGGGLLITVPQHMAFWCVLDEKTGHRRRYVGDELARKVSEAGFEVLTDTSFMAALFLPQYISRRWLSQAESTESETEHALPSMLNEAFAAVLAAELATIRAGVRYPFGGLRLVAARRPV